MIRRGGGSIVSEALPRALVLSLAILVPAEAWAYRPFDSTDADVAAPGEFEIELGAAGYLKEGPDRYVVAPAVVANYGMPGGRELVLQGQVQRALQQDDLHYRTSLEDIGLFVKQLLRRGSLQEAAGPSLATEYGLLLPTIHGEPGAGASVAGIVSERSPEATVHLNGALGLTREHRADAFVGVIVEGPARWTVRPVAELFVEQTAGHPLARSALTGVIWRAGDRLSFDVGIRAGRTEGLPVRELRAGLTFSFGR